VESSTLLREWVNKSQYRGSIRRFSAALGVPLKTAEDWGCKFCVKRNDET